MDKLIVKGARVHNLKNIDVVIPKNKLVVITGLSGSGKSSLAMDTIFIEGQRRYLESLSTYARQFIGELKKPDVDSIEGLSPTIAIDQKSVSHNPRSTVGTVTEIYDYLRVLYAQIGVPHCPNCGSELQKMSVDEIVSHVVKHFQGKRVLILSPIAREKKGTFKEEFESFLNRGFTRVEVDGQVYRLEEVPELNKNVRHNVSLVIDRIEVSGEDTHRLFQSIELALKEGNGFVLVRSESDEHLYSEKLSCLSCGFSMPEINPKLFSFNAPYGACPDCHGLGFKLEVDEDSLFEEELPIIQGLRIGHKADGWLPRRLERIVREYGGNVDKPFFEQPLEVKEAVLYGTEYFEGIVRLVKERYEEYTSEEMREWIVDNFFVERTCQTCKGKRLRREALSVTIDNLSIIDFTELPISKELKIIRNLPEKITPKQYEAIRELLQEIEKRLDFLERVGLGYLSLSRNVRTLSGGEAQRIRLATQIGSKLTGVIYVLDEPTIGLHQRDNSKLISMLKELRDLGNTVIVVEHDEEVIESADYIVDIGPRAGVNGGNVVFQGPVTEILKSESSLTGKYLSGRLKIEVPKERRRGNGNHIRIVGARHNNLKDLTVEFPLGTFICVTGVSGSGKSSLIIDTLYPAISNKLHRTRHEVGEHDRIEGLENIDKIIAIDQSPIGRTPRSNPATYTKVFDAIRELFAMTPEAKARGYDKGRFSFNVKGGRCEACTGQGVVKIEMMFLPEVYVECEVCKGKRYNSETLEVTYKGKNIADVLDMTVEEALEFFKNIPTIKDTLQVLYDVGLGYIKLGQPATTLSGGEAQRVKLASELRKKATGRTLYILDEPTVGLHFEDVKRLIEVLNRLVDKGNTVIVIEHNLDVIKSADYIIDLGPEGGDAGGYLVASGTPEEVAKVQNSWTGLYLKKILNSAKMGEEAS
ncbi:MAG: excinuclease ABC subunit UvrA [Fervidobacterium sp.]|uniref:UvrABC system protein A n=1 Tax=Fervidobacterium gondwanense DSM 13020 TaxID=1121883 RepID=A0A1M7RUW7_FERGO|nr:excinuclease ABC subunit UvrA [Fervidobacterium gondwanense]UXF01913.1 excinuclease ABC subunit A [Fervidobacterium riparium]SHN49946.1 Excinuclease ABC subunit A [Fervidobacterium gondwanense DSM 13020]